MRTRVPMPTCFTISGGANPRSEEHTSELQSQFHLVCRLLHEKKNVLIVADGLGGLPIELGGKTELETARTPNLDAMVREGVCGLSIPVLPGIAPGSGPGHRCL